VGWKMPEASETLLPPTPATVWLSVIQAVFEGLSSLSAGRREAISPRRNWPTRLVPGYRGSPESRASPSRASPA
jgi:hypothetical protein